MKNGFPAKGISRKVTVALYPNIKAIEVHFALNGLDFNRHYVWIEADHDDPDTFWAYARSRKLFPGAISNIYITDEADRLIMKLKHLASKDNQEILE